MGGGSSVPAKYRRSSVSETMESISGLIQSIKPSAIVNGNIKTSDVPELIDLERAREAIAEFHETGHWNSLSISKLKMASHLATTKKLEVSDLASLFVQEIMSVVEDWKSSFDNQVHDTEKGATNNPTTQPGIGAQEFHIYVAACVSNKYVKRTPVFQGAGKKQSNQEFTVICSTLGTLGLGVIPFHMQRSNSELNFTAPNGSSSMSGKSNTTEKFELEGLKMSTALLKECEDEDIPPCDLEPTYQKFKLGQSGMPNSSVHALCFPWLQNSRRDELEGTIVLYRVVKEQPAEINETTIDEEETEAKDAQTTDAASTQITRRETTKLEVIQTGGNKHAKAFTFLAGDQSALLRAYLMDVGSLLSKEIRVNEQNLNSELSANILSTVMRLAKQLYNQKSDSLEVKLSTVVEVMEKQIPCNRITVMIHDSDHRELWCMSKATSQQSKWGRLRSVLRDENVSKFWVPSDSFKLESNVIRTGRLSNIWDAQSNPDFNKSFYESKCGVKVVSVLAVPIVHDKQKKVIGVIQFFNRRGENSWFNSHDEVLSQAVTEELGGAISVTALENLYRTERNQRGVINSVVDGAQIESLLSMYSSQVKLKEGGQSAEYKSLLKQLKSDLHHDDNDFQTFSESVELLGDLDDKHPDLVDWNLSTFDKKPEDLIDMSIRVFHTFNLTQRFRISPGKLRAFLQNISDSYIETNPYHNFYHGFQVMHSVFMMLSTSSSSQILKVSEMLALLIAAVGHDVGHPGTNNAFQVAVNSPMALTYNDKSVLENFHAAKTFEILRDEDCAILENIDETHYRSIRDVIIQSILATDISSHYKLMTAVNERIAFGATDDKVVKEDRRMSFYEEQTDMTCILRRSRNVDRQLLCRMMLHCGDLNNATLPFFLAKEWTVKVVQEFNDQYKKETELGIPATEFMKVVPSDTRGVAGLQVNFMDFVAAPLWEAMGQLFPALLPRVKEIAVNRSIWIKTMQCKSNEEANEVVQRAIESSRRIWSGKRNSVLLSNFSMTKSKSTRSLGNGESVDENNPS